MVILIKRLTIYFLLGIVLMTGAGLSSCKATYYKIPIVKSRKHFRPYDSKRDRRKKRVKIKKYKSLKKTRSFKHKSKDD